MLALAPTDYINSHSIPGMTRVINGSENIMAAISQFLSDTKNVIYSCGDYRGPSIAIEVQEYRKLISNLRSRGINLKYITEITSKNIHYCKELMKLGYEIRHLDGIKANFSINETAYVASTTVEESQPIPQLIYSNIKDIVIQQKYVFDSFWNKAVPAEQKIREIEENIEPEIFETITDHEIASQILIDLAKSVKKEALFLLPNDKSMVRIDKLGIVDFLVKASQKSDSIIIRIICPLSDENSEVIKKIIENAPRIKVVNGTDSPYGMYVVDNERAFRVELKEPSAKTFSEAIGFAVYSNRPSTVEFFKSVFELLWKQRMLNEELKRADKMQKEFINIAAHELKTPTQAILGFSGLLKHYPERRDEVIEVINRNAARLQTLITNILDVTRIESQNLKLNVEEFSISDLISAIIEDYKERIKGKKTNLELVYNYKDNNDPILVEADKERIIQVISNLLSNSLQFTKEGHITIDVGLAIDDKKSREVIVTVSDTGSGMDPEIMPRLFTRFASKSFQGTGLGLYISKSIIEAHGGKIWAGKNQDGKGARISFTLPVKINGQVRKEKEEPRS
jgi:two-component system, OmpR family, sensor histidine kinase VicK